MLNHSSASLRSLSLSLSLPFALLGTAVLAASACSSDNKAAAGEPIGCAAKNRDTSYDPPIDPANFVSGINNKYYPLVPGTVSKYETGVETVVITVTSETKVIQGVTCMVVHDVASQTSTGAVLEDTYDWFAQDKDGNVWYFGEDTKAYPDGPKGKANTAGAWTAGVDCAKAGIIMKGDPKIGDTYRQEYLAGSAEDRADVVSLTEKVKVPYMDYTMGDCLMTKDYTDLAPGHDENKYFCPGVGQVLVAAIVTVGMGEREELVSITKK